MKLDPLCRKCALAGVFGKGLRGQRGENFANFSVFWNRYKIQILLLLRLLASSCFVLFGSIHFIVRLDWGLNRGRSDCNGCSRITPENTWLFRFPQCTVDPSAPTVLRARVQTPSTTPMLLWLEVETYTTYTMFHWIVKRLKTDKKRPGLVHIYKSVYCIFSFVLPLGT